MIKDILQQIYPSNCVLCGVSCNTGRNLCNSCAADIRVNNSACSRCAIPLPLVSQGSLCGQCLQNPPEYNAAWSAFIYAQPLEWMIHQLKFNAKLSFATTMSALAEPHLPVLNSRPDCIVPVPLHLKRIKERGFNQALELVKPLAQKLAIPIDTKSCFRKNSTSAQTGLNAKHRRQNIKDAFVFKNTHKYKYIVLFDDVVTTGSTMGELAKIIKLQGVERVDVWSLARAEKSSQKNKNIKMENLK